MVGARQDVGNGPVRGRRTRAEAGLWPWLVAVLALLVPSGANAQPREYKVKAAFLLNFVNFVQWPSTASGGTNSPILVGVLGKDPFESSLEETLQGETSHGTAFSIVRSEHVEALTNCQVVFISKSEKSHMDEVLRVLMLRPILTVSETDGFAQQGGALNFYRHQGHVRFEINPEAAQRQGLKVSSELLRLGKIVQTRRATQ